MTPLDVAKKRKRVDVMKFLEENGKVKFRHKFNHSGSLTEAGNPASLPSASKSTAGNQYMYNPLCILQIIICIIRN